MHYLYGMAAAICAKLQKSENLRTVMTKFQPWQDFVLNDLQEYEKSLDEVLGEPANTAAKHLNDHSIRRIIIDLNQKEFSSVNAIDKEEQIEDMGFLDLYYEVIRANRGFKRGRDTVIRKNSMESPRKKSRDLLNEEIGLTPPPRIEPKCNSMKDHGLDQVC